MPTGQPDPRSRARPLTPEPHDPGSAEFLGLDQAFDEELGADPSLFEAEADFPDTDGFVAGTWDPDPHDPHGEGSYGEPSWETELGDSDPHAATGYPSPDADAGPEGLDDIDFDLEEAEAASWLMELDEDALDGLGVDALRGAFPEPEFAAPPGPQGEFEAAEVFDTPPAPAPTRSPLLLAAVVVLSVGAGVALSRVANRLPFPTTSDRQDLAQGPARTPAAPAPPRAVAGPPPTAGEPLAEEPSVAAGEPGALASADPDAGPATGIEPTEPTGQPGPSPDETLLVQEPSAPVGQGTALLQPSLSEPVSIPPTPGAGWEGSSTAAAPPEPVRTVGLVEPEPLAPLRGPVREATAADLANLWPGNAIPMEALDRRQDLVTPHVGRVRVVTYNGEIYEGRLHAIGRGKVWLQSGPSRMALMGWQISRIEHVLGNDDTPALGERGSQELAGLPTVRVRTPGGVFYGKLIARQGDRVTLLTDDGARISLERGVVEPAGRSRTRVVELVD